MVAIRPDAASAFQVSYERVPVLVLGATGFIGRMTARWLATAGADLTIGTRDPARAASLLELLGIPARIEPCDLLDLGALRSAIASLRPAVVFNLAAFGVGRSERDPALMSAINTASLEVLCDTLVGQSATGWNGQQLVHCGSALEYGTASGHLSEDGPATPTTDYGRTKLRATHHVVEAARAGLRGVVARLFTVYGPGERAGRLLPSLMAAATTGGAVALSAGLQRRDFTYVEDAVEGLLRLGAVTAAPDVVVNLGTGHLSTVRAFVEAAAQELAIDPARLQFGALPGHPDEMWHDDVDVMRLANLTGWLPTTTIPEGVRRSWEWEHARR